MARFLPYATDGFPGLKVPERNRIIVTPAITILSEGQEIGFITDITPETTRRVERIRHLNFADAGRIVEQVPAPSDFTLRVNGFSLYASTLMARISGQRTGDEETPDVTETDPGGIILVENWLDSLLFDVNWVIKHPTKDNVNYTVIFGDCVMVSHSQTVSIRNLYVTATATIQPTWLRVVPGDSGIENP